MNHDDRRGHDDRDRLVDEFFAAHRDRVVDHPADDESWEVIRERAGRGQRSRGMWFLAGAVAASAEASFRDAVLRTPSASILVGRRRELEAEVARALSDRLAASGVAVAVDHVRVVDAHPPREVVPAYRDVSAAASDVERFRNDAEAFAAERRWSARGEAAAASSRPKPASVIPRIPPNSVSSSSWMAINSAGVR